MGTEPVTEPDGVQPQRMESGAQFAQRGMTALALWCIEYVDLIEQGRPYGFRMAVSPAVKDAVATLCPDRRQAVRINANLLDVPG